MLNPYTAYELAQATMAERIREADHQRLIRAAQDFQPSPAGARSYHTLALDAAHYRHSPHPTSASTYGLL